MQRGRGGDEDLFFLVFLLLLLFPAETRFCFFLAAGLGLGVLLPEVMLPEFEAIFLPLVNGKPNPFLAMAS